MDVVQGGEPIVEYRWRAAKITWSKISAFIFLRKIRPENFLKKRQSYFNQLCSSRRTSRSIIETHDTWDGLTLSLEATISVSGPSGQPIYRKKCVNIGWNMKRFLLAIWWKVIFKTWCFTKQKRQKLVTEMYHKSCSSPEPQWRISWQKLALFSSFINLCLNISLVYWCARSRGYN